MPELALLLLIPFVVGLGAGLLLPVTYRLPFVGRCRTSPTGEHEYVHLRGAYGYCSFCTARRRFLRG